MNPFDTPTPATNIVATIGGISPLWIDNLSVTAATWLPILGCAWLIMQAGIKLYSMYKNSKEPKA